MNTPLLDKVVGLLGQWEDAFCQHRSFWKAQRHALGLMLTMGSVQISRVLWTLGLGGRDWSAEYRHFSRSKWDPQDCFKPILAAAVRGSEGPYVDMAGDFTHIKKCGRKIAGIRLMRDPASDLKWNNPLIYGLQYLQLGWLAPVPHLMPDGSTGSAARCLPMHFSSVPSLQKPGKKASEEERKAYKQDQLKRPAMVATRHALRNVRAVLDAHQGDQQILSVVLDGSFANRTMLAEPMDRIQLICRCRRNARLRFGETSNNTRRFYKPGLFTPDAIRTDHAQYPFSEALIHLTGRTITVRYKTITNVYWPSVGKRRPLRLLMVAQPHHKAKGTPGQVPTFDQRTYHIITTDLHRPAHEIIQRAFDRWQIEVSHREEKTVFGIGDAQVRNARSVQRHPAFAVACYSLLHLAAIELTKQNQHSLDTQLPKWRKTSGRPSIQTLLNILRNEIQKNPTTLTPWEIHPDPQRIVQACAA